MTDYMFSRVTFEGIAGLQPVLLDPYSFCTNDVNQEPMGSCVNLVRAQLVPQVDKFRPTVDLGKNEGL